MTVDAERIPARRGRPGHSLDSLLDTAVAVFNERGYEATTMRAIAERAGCALGLIYRYFPRRDDFVLELYRALEDATRARW